MNKKLLEDLAITDGIYDCICDPYDKFNTGDYYGSVMWDLERFAEKIVRECVQVGGPEDSYTDEWFKAKADSVAKIKEHFGIEQ